MRKLVFVLSLFLMSSMCVNCAQSMFDADGNYSGEWKQMTNIKTGTSSKYSSSSYSSSAWYANNEKQKRQKAQAAYSNQSVNKMDVMPFRYNTLDYTRIRKVKGGYGDYNARCSDIGDASFCH